jgi:predicted unusual protein kinase regulating ubiquinone biosynthesis (AarF/ABC1/UbiB family)
MFYDFEQGRIPVFTTNHTLAFRHHLRLPSRLWLLDKTLAMMEGGVYKLMPSFSLV